MLLPQKKSLHLTVITPPKGEPHVVLPTDAGKVSDQFYTRSWKGQQPKLESASSIRKGFCRTRSQPCADGAMPNVLPPSFSLP